MKTLGLIGGTSWHSTVEYYSNINQAVNDHFGDNTNPPLIVFNLNQSLVHRYQVEDNWDGVADLLIDAAERLQKAGAEAVMFCANTPHKMFDIVNEKVDVPILHIADATANAITRKGLKSVCFIGTKFSMEEAFVTDRIAQHGRRLCSSVAAFLLRRWAMAIHCSAFHIPHSNHPTTIE